MKTRPRQFFKTVKEWDQFLIKMKPGTMVTVRKGHLMVFPFTFKGKLKDV